MKITPLLFTKEGKLFELTKPEYKTIKRNTYLVDCFGGGGILISPKGKCKQLKEGKWEKYLIPQYGLTTWVQTLAKQLK